MWTQTSSRVVLKGQDVTLTWLEPTCLPDRRDIFGVTVVPVTADGDIVLARLRRGLEVPGGGIEDTDPDTESTAHREAWEEARIRMGELTLIQLISVHFHSGRIPTKYVLVYAGRVTHQAPFVAAHESLDRVVVTPADYIAHHGFGPVRDRRRLMAKATAALRANECRALLVA